MSISVTCVCSKRLQIRDEWAGKMVRCPGCGKAVRVPAHGVVAPSGDDKPTVASPTTAPATPSAFPALGFAIGWAAVVVGCLLAAGGMLITAATYLSDGDFKPAGLLVFGFPGLLWVLFGGLLLSLRRRFAMPFWAFLVVNLLVGVLFTTGAGSLRTAGDRQIFAAIGLGFIFGSVLFQLFHGLLLRDLRRQGAEKRKGGS
jgi:hypothetical protein